MPECCFRTTLRHFCIELTCHHKLAVKLLYAKLFKSENPQALAKWYDDNLGVSIVPQDYDMPSWQQEAGSTVFAPFAADTTYFGSAKQQWMINFRVADIHAMITQLEAADIAVMLDPEKYPNGLFARLDDPEGNPIQLWQEI